MPDQEQRDEMHADATRLSQAYPSEVGTEWSTWRPLHLPMFRNLLIADLVSDMGTFMQGVGAEWLMVSQGAGPLLVALTQAASAFPFFLLALPAGALGDIFDRRKLILTTELWMFSVAVAVALAILTALHLITPWALLRAIGDALGAPTWRAVLPELVPQQGLMPAIALNGIEFNLARALGPALGGFLIVAAGIGTVFWLNAASYLGVLWMIAWWKRPPNQPGPLRETVSGAIRAAVRHTRNAPDILTVLGRIGCAMFFASAFWALLPTVAHELPSDHRLAAFKAINPRDLVGETFVTVSDTAPVLRKVIDNYLKRSGINIKPTREVDNLAMAMSLISSTGGVGLLPAYAQNFLLSSVTSRPLKGDTPTVELVLGYKKSNESPILKLLLSRLDELVARVSKKAQ